MKILIGGALRGRQHLERIQRELEAALESTHLRDIEFAYDLHDENDVWGGAIHDSDVLLIPTSRGFSGKALAKAKRLRFVQKLGVPDGVDVEACRKHGIVVSALPNPGHVAVAEHTLMFMLSMARHAWSGQAAVMRGDNPHGLEAIKTEQARRHSNWLNLSRDAFSLLGNQTLGLVGFGDIAQEVAQRVRCFGMRILYTRRTAAASKHGSELGATYVDLRTLLGTADFVSLHAIQSKATQPIIGAGELALMKPGAILINTSRGDQVDQAALIAALREKRIGGACLDVYAIEPAPAGEFNGLSNVLLTPHTAGVIPWEQRFKDALVNIEAFFANGPVAGLI